VPEPNVGLLVRLTEFSSRGFSCLKTSVCVCMCMYDDYNDQNDSNNNYKIENSDKGNTCSDNKLTLNVSWNNLSYII
jgi:hypothetical protein